jgi:transcriptional regulator with XRE-family HTH domain
MKNAKLKEIRVRNNFTQTQMGEIMHMTQSAYQKLENGVSTLRIDQIILLIKQFGAEAKDLLETHGIEIVFKNNSLNNSKISEEPPIERFNNFPSEKLDKILDEINSLKNRFT